MNPALERVLQNHRSVTIAVSGGVDSMTLAYAANLCLGKAATMVHAVSPAVPKSATSLVREYADKYNWNLRIVDAKEFLDEQYVANPANRCFFCKSNLYQTLSNLGVGQVMSGTNTDDLSDWRPGLKAAKNFEVIHPYVEADMSKSDIRMLAREYGLSDIAELPASPCLSSRIETGISIDPNTLRFVDRVERMVRKKLTLETVRCRVRDQAIEVSLDDDTYDRLSNREQADLVKEVRRLRPDTMSRPVRVGKYKRGDAFIR